ncbi:MAG: Fic family protein [Bacteroidota bacterium]
MADRKMPQEAASDPLDDLRTYSAKPVGERPVSRYHPALLAAGRAETLITVSPGSLKPLDPATQNQYVADFAYASSALEGGGYSRLEVRALLRFGERAIHRSLDDAVLVKNHAAALKHLFRSPDLAEIFRLHALLTDDCGLVELSHSLHCLPQRHRGVTRGNAEAASAASSYQPPYGEAVLEHGIVTILATAAEIRHPLQAAFYLATRIPYLQPFRDGNKRLARTLAMVPLLRAGWPPISFSHVRRHEYLAGLRVFFELGDCRLAEECFAEAYRQSLV